MNVKILSPKELEIESLRVWQRLGYDHPPQMALAVLSAFHHATELGKQLLMPVACYCIYNIEMILSSSMVEIGGKSLCSRELAFRVRGAKELVVFIATIGQRLEEKVEELFSSDPVTAFILDHYGSEGVITLTNKVRASLQEYAVSKGYRVGRRYCPGYGDWKTLEQRKLFELLDGRRIGVRLSSDCMMYPRKSYAGILPLGPDVAEVMHDERCCTG